MVPIKKNDDVCSITTTYLYVWQIEWMKKNGVKRSEFIRNAVTERIESLGGSSTRLRNLQKKRDATLHELHMLDEQIMSIEQTRDSTSKLSDLEKAKRMIELRRRYGDRINDEFIDEVISTTTTLTRPDILELIADGNP